MSTPRNWAPCTHPAPPPRIRSCPAGMRPGEASGLEPGHRSGLAVAKPRFLGRVLEAAHLGRPYEIHSRPVAQRRHRSQGAGRPHQTPQGVPPPAPALGTASHRAPAPVRPPHPRAPEAACLRGASPGDRQVACDTLPALQVQDRPSCRQAIPSCRPECRPRDRVQWNMDWERCLIESIGESRLVTGDFQAGAPPADENGYEGGGQPGHQPRPHALPPGRSCPAVQVVQSPAPRPTAPYASDETYPPSEASMRQ